MIRTDKIAKRFGTLRALSGLSLHVEQGAIYGFLGPNGAGKTTTLRILSGLARADQGQAWIMGQRVGLRTLGQRPMLGVLPEEPAFYPWMTAREYLRDFIAPLHRLRGAEAARRAAELLETVGLSEAADRRLGGFSRGMRQRIGLAQALIHRPQILLLDEPVSALDPAGRKEVLDLIESLRGQTTVMLSTHILSEVQQVCSRILIINRGRIIAEDTPSQLRSRLAGRVLEMRGDPINLLRHAAHQDPGVEDVAAFGDRLHLRIREGASDAVLGRLPETVRERGGQVVDLRPVPPVLEDVFIALSGSGPEAEDSND